MTNRTRVGDLGENLVSSVFNWPKSSDAYDDEKDLLDKDGNTVEVKTQNRVTVEGIDYFSIHWAAFGEKYYSNFCKCSNVDRLLFVEYASLKSEFAPKIHPNIINIWECFKHGPRDGKRYMSRIGWMYGWPIEDMTMLYSVADESLANKFREYSQAGSL